MCHNQSVMLSLSSNIIIYLHTQVKLSFLIEIFVQKSAARIIRTQHNLTTRRIIYVPHFNFALKCQELVWWVQYYLIYVTCYMFKFYYLNMLCESIISSISCYERCYHMHHSCQCIICLCRVFSIMTTVPVTMWWDISSIKSAHTRQWRTSQMVSFTLS